MTTTEKLASDDTFHVERLVHGDWRINSRDTDTYETARAWAHQPDTRVVMTTVTTYVCSDGMEAVDE